MTAGKTIFLRCVILTVLVTFFTTMIGVASAAEPKHPIDKWQEAQKDITTPGIKKTLVEAEKKWDTELNVQYKKLMSKLTPANKKLLQDSQRKWIAHRDAEFKLLDELYMQWYEAAGGGTIWDIVYLDFRVEFVRRRALVFIDYLKNFTD